MYMLPGIYLSFTAEPEQDPYCHYNQEQSPVAQSAGAPGQKQSAGSQIGFECAGKMLAAAEV